jgi:ketosteroid isomerase-like protein
MKRVFCLALIALGVIWIASCENRPATNTGNTNANANSNANANKTTAAAPSKDALFEMDKKANEAFYKGDSKFFEGFLGDKFVMYEAGHKMDRAALLKMVAETKCEVKTWSLEEPEMVVVDPDTAVIVYKSNFDGTCNGQKMPSPMRAASVYTRSGDKWVGAYHAETPIMDPKSPQKMPPPPPPPPADKKDSNTASNSNADAKPAAPAPDPNTDALVALEKSGWEAWKARDAKKLEEITMKTLGFIGPFGNYTANQAETLKSWTEGKCEIKSVDVTNPSVTMLSPTVAMMNFKGIADGSCDGMKLVPVWGTNIYVKDGGNWKLAFGFETPAA